VLGCDVYNCVVGKPEDKRPHEVLGRDWNVNVMAWSDLSCKTVLLELHKVFSDRSS
jgi:hypothetical protein